ncbi:ABC transporter substrate-binding protein [Microbacterium sp.]|uniref:ABC transporter substrate-binding protein n=1 Tax=Microbacterium sp. TaxID=51671 RepID=UPI0026081122|nr:extracellular solute-binding protein [uncultured Microbacterium sp.]
MRKALAAVAGLSVAALALAGCSSSPSDSGSNGNKGGDSASQVEVFTWWASGSEKTGLDALVKVFNEQYPKTKFVNAAVAGGAGSNAKNALASRLKANNPPDSFQAHAGAELTDYIEANKIEDLSSFYKDNGLNDVFPKTLLDRLTVDGKIYSVPSNIHRANVVWVNTSVLEKAGIDPKTAPADIDAWLADMKKLKDAGVQTPLSVATDWTQVQLFENVLLADLGADGYTGLWDGSTKFDDSKVTKAIKDYTALLSYANTDGTGQDWPVATDMVIDGTAAYNVMGDWALAEFDAKSKTYGTDYTTWPTPGTDGTFDFLADSFTLPVGAPHAEGAKNWLKTISSADGQKAFNLAKGSIPARTDANASDYPEYQQGAMASFAKDTVVSSLAHGAAVKVSWLNDITSAIGQFVSTKDAKTLQDALVAAQTKGLGK